MKVKKDNSITQSLLKDLIQADQERQKQIPTISECPVEPADLAHDAGEGYNTGFVFPQQ